MEYYFSKIETLNHEDKKLAIPGGKYGCALLAKLKGPLMLQQLPLGRLIAIVSTALRNEFLVHSKTFIVKNKRQF